MLTEHNGTAVDAAIATLFCEGVVVSQSMVTCFFFLILNISKFYIVLTGSRWWVQSSHVPERKR